MYSNLRNILDNNVLLDQAKFLVSIENDTKFIDISRQDLTYQSQEKIKLALNFKSEMTVNEF